MDTSRETSSEATSLQQGALRSRRRSRRSLLRGVAVGAAGATGLAVAGAGLLSRQVTAHAASSRGTAQGLEGGWKTTITLQGNSPFAGLITFAAGGGLVDTQQIDLNQQGTPGIGSWHATGEDTFALNFFKIASDAKGNVSFTVQFILPIQLTEDQKAFHGKGTFTVFDSHGKKQFTNTIQFDGTRIEAEGS